MYFKARFAGKTLVFRQTDYARSAHHNYQLSIKSEFRRNLVGLIGVGVIFVLVAADMR